MAERISRKVRFRMNRHDMRVSRIENGKLKRKERARRHLRLKSLLSQGSLPYTPTVMSWLSAELDKPSTQITAEDVQAFLAKA
ncbi:hypothetical protein [Tuwongella immobilis]|uniref:Marine sediment metagenome DNA, contig: S01H1_S36603 n=1 Tax=Tuwongella immobilis TaxID=692036 RepID=A0A6C2YVL6_9BACT